MSDETNRLVDIIVGGLFVVFHASGRFNTPVTNRSSTSAGRYFLSLFCYWLVGLILYGVMVMFPHLLTLVLHGDQGAVEPWAQKLSNPLIAALLLTVALPKLPVLASIDNWIRKELQDMAAIPYEVRRMIAELRKDKLDPGAEARDAVRERLTNAGFNPKDINFEFGRTPTYLWTRLAVLLENLSHWETDKKMARWMALDQGEVAQLRKRYETLNPKAKTCFRLLNEATAEDATTRTHEALIRYQEDFMDQVIQLHDAVLEFISRGVLHSLLTDNARIERLRILGFQVELAPVRLTFNDIIVMFGLLFGMLLSGLIFFAAEPGISFGSRLTRLIMVAAIYCVAIGCAVFIRRKDAAVQRHAGGEKRQIGFYVLAGAVAVLISQIINLVLNAVMLHSLEHSLQRFMLTYPWMLSTFATAVTTSALLDNPRFPGCSRMSQRLIEGLIQGTIMIGVSYLVHSWLVERAPQPVLATLPFTYRVPAMGQITIMAGLIGFVVGFCIPTWYREAPRSRPQIRESDCSVTSPSGPSPFPGTAGTVRSG
jgi:hypothetical protein